MLRALDPFRTALAARTQAAQAAQAKAAANDADDTPGAATADGSGRKGDPHRDWVAKRRRDEVPDTAWGKRRG